MLTIKIICVVLTLPADSDQRPTADENWREEAERDLRVKAFSRVDDKKELEKPTKDSRERIQGARENLTLDPIGTRIERQSLALFFFA